MPADEFKADYQQLEEVAAKFNSAAQAVQEVQQKVRVSYGKLANKGWIGMGATAFFDEMETKVLPSQERLQDALEKAGQATHKIAAAVKQADEDASSPFRALFGG